MNTKLRYRVGFPDGVTCGTLSANPDLIAVIDTKNIFAFGVAIAFCSSQYDAEQLAEKLNKLDRIENALK